MQRSGFRQKAAEFPLFDGMAWTLEQACPMYLSLIFVLFPLRADLCMCQEMCQERLAYAIQK